MGRRPYSTMVRPFRDSDTEVKIRWYPARPEDGALPFTSKICSLDWVTRPETVEGVAEVFGASRNFNRAKTIPGPKRTHVCGTRQDHGLGGVYDPSRPPMVYQPSGLPLCCEPDRREVEVPVAVGITSTATTSPPYPSTVSTRALVESHTVRSDVYRSTLKVPGVIIDTFTIRTNPYRSVVGVSADPLSQLSDPTPRLSVVEAALEPFGIETTGSGCVPSGLNCVDAPNGPLNQYCLRNFFFVGDFWWRWNIDPNVTYEFRTRIGNVDSYPGPYQVLVGTDCATAQVQEEGGGLQDHHTVPITLPGDVVWFHYFFPGNYAQPPFVEIGVFEVP